MRRREYLSRAARDLIAGREDSGLAGDCWGLRLRRCLGEDLLGGGREIAHVGEEGHQLPELLLA